MTWKSVFFLFAIFLFGCSEPNPQDTEPSGLIESLIGTTWESTDCKSDYIRRAYTTHFFDFTEDKLIFNYQYNNEDCSEVLAESIEHYSYTIGDEQVTSDGIVAIQANIERPILGPNGVYDVKDLLYVKDGFLYFGELVKREDCEIGNAKADVETPLWSVFYCDQQSTKLDFENYYIRKI